VSEPSTGDEDVEPSVSLVLLCLGLIWYVRMWRLLRKLRKICVIPAVWMRHHVVSHHRHCPLSNPPPHPQFQLHTPAEVAIEVPVDEHVAALDALLLLVRQAQVVSEGVRPLLREQPLLLGYGGGCEVCVCVWVGTDVGESVGLSRWIESMDQYHRQQDEASIQSNDTVVT
jgi:hypothetical protein